MKIGFVVRHEIATNEAKDNAEQYCGNPECDKLIEDPDWDFCPFCGCKFLSKEESKIIIVENQIVYAIYVGGYSQLGYNNIKTEEQALNIAFRIKEKYPKEYVEVKQVSIGGNHE
jgi:RNA polymerase subunit RPABC4/transcription elongation factor Spt4